MSSGIAMSTMMYCEWLPMQLESAFTFVNPATLVLSGAKMTIETIENNSFVFMRKTIVLQDLQSCIQAYDGCHNMCYKELGETNRACKKEMACGSTPKDAQCLMGTNDIDFKNDIKFITACTMEYNPICGSKSVQCIKAPCPAIQQTYGNICAMHVDKASFVSTGECKTDTPPIVWNDKDEHGCIGSAGYTWSQSKGECVRVWEQTSELEKAYDFAYNNGITTMDSLKKFRTDDSITRQEAAKMFVVFAKKVLGKTREEGFSSECNETLDESWFGSPNGIDDIDPTLSSYLVDACKANIMKGWPIPHTNGAMSFWPFQRLTKAQSLTILMRLVDGRQDESVRPRWENYYKKAAIWNYIALPSMSEMEQSITRGDLIQRIQLFNSHLKS
jgi:hypothetical protein